MPTQFYEHMLAQTHDEFMKNFEPQKELTEITLPPSSSPESSYAAIAVIYLLFSVGLNQFAVAYHLDTESYTQAATSGLLAIETIATANIPNVFLLAGLSWIYYLEKS